MLLTRVIPILLLDGDALVKTHRFKSPRYLGDPINAVTIFNEKEVDEIVLLDISATNEAREPNFDLIADIASQAFMPFSYGGGITSMEHIRRLFSIGVEKVVLNGINFHSFDLIREAARVYGRQSIVGAIDINKTLFGKYVVCSNSAKTKHSASPVEWAQSLEAAGVGELIITSVDRESTFEGYDVAMMKQVADAVGIPVVANGGAAELKHFEEVKREAKISAVAAGSMFVYHGKHRAVLITYPSVSDLENVFGE